MSRYFVISLHHCNGLLLGQRFQLFDLFYQVCFLVIELLIVRAVIVEFGQKVNQFVLVTQQDVQDGFRFVRVGNKHLSSNIQH